jgi:hypothetical protein
MVCEDLLNAALQEIAEQETRICGLPNIDFSDDQIDKLLKQKLIDFRGLHKIDEPVKKESVEGMMTLEVANESPYFFYPGRKLKESSSPHSTIEPKRGLIDFKSLESPAETRKTPPRTTKSMLFAKLSRNSDDSDNMDLDEDSFQF